MNQENTVEVFSTGAGLDYRTDEQKNKDWRPEEAFAPSPVVWKEKSVEDIQKAIKAHSISQGSTSRCVTEYAGIALEMAELEEGKQSIVFSRRDVYVRRANRPNAGMAMADLFKVMIEGVCLESQLPSTATQEWELDKQYEVTDEMKKARAMYAAGSSFTFNKFNIDDIARTIDMGIPVCLFWYFASASNEWWRQTPVINDPKLDLYNNDTTYRHQCTAIDYAIVNGVKTLIVMDSSGQGTGFGTQGNLRYITEDFFNKRCYGAGFTIDKKNLDYKPDEAIKYYFNENLSFGSQGTDVQNLQKILVLEGCLSIKTPTIYYQGMTQAAVKKLQEKYASQILAPLGLKQGTGNFGNATRAFINQKYHYSK